MTDWQMAFWSRKGCDFCCMEGKFGFENIQRKSIIGTEHTIHNVLLETFRDLIKTKVPYRKLLSSSGEFVPFCISAFINIIKLLEAARSPVSEHPLNMDSELRWAEMKGSRSSVSQRIVFSLVSYKEWKRLHCERSIELLHQWMNLAIRPFLIRASCILQAPRLKSTKIGGLWASRSLLRWTVVIMLHWKVHHVHSKIIYAHCIFHFPWIRG